MEQMLQQLQQPFEAEFKVNQTQAERLQKVQKFEQQTGQVAELNQILWVVQFEMTTALARSIEIVMDPTLSSFRGMDPQQVEYIEDHNRVEGRVDNSKVHFQFLEQMTDRKVVGNLGLGTDLGVDNPEAHTDTKVDLKVHIDIGVDLEVHTESGVDLEKCTIPQVCTVLEVAPQAVIGYLDVAPQAIIEDLEAAPQAITGHLEVADQEQHLTS